MIYSNVRRDKTPTVNRYNYSVSEFKGIDADTNPSVLPLSYASYAYNVGIKNGVITKAFGLNKLVYSTKIYYPSVSQYMCEPIDMCVYRRFDATTGAMKHYLVYFLSDKKVMCGLIGGDEFTQIAEFSTTLRMTFLNYNYNGADSLLMIGDGGDMRIYNGTAVTAVTGCPKLDDACIHAHRVYGASSDGGNRVYFSKEMDPADWTVSATAGGYVSFPDDGGKVRRVISFKGQLYIFRDNSIFRMSAYGDQTDYTLTKVYGTNNVIYAKTAAAVNDKIVFLTEDGFYCTDGYTVKKLLKNLTPLIADKTYANACCYNGKYYVAVKMKTDNNTVGDEYNNTFLNNAVFSHDFDDGSVEIMRGADVKAMYPVNIDGVSDLLFNLNEGINSCSTCYVTDDGKLFGETLPKKWLSPVTDLGKADKIKILRRLYVTSDGRIDVNAVLDKTYSYRLYGTARTQMVPINRRAEFFGLEICSDSDDFKVSGLLAEFDLIRRGKDE